MRNGFEQEWRDRFREFAELSEDDAGIAGWSESGLAARFRRFRRLSGERSISGCWIDAGCGAGTYARYLVSRGAYVVAADYSLPTICKARKRGAEGIGLIVADIRRLPLRPRSMSGALCFGVTQALSNSGDALVELKQCLAPGGELWVDALNRYCLPNIFEIWHRRLHRKSRHLRYEGPWALKRAFVNAGLVDVRLHWMPIMPRTLRALQPWVESVPAQLALKLLAPLSSLVSHAFIVTGRCR